MSSTLWRTMWDFHSIPRAVSRYIFTSCLNDTWENFFLILVSFDYTIVIDLINFLLSTHIAPIPPIEFAARLLVSGLMHAQTLEVCGSFSPPARIGEADEQKQGKFGKCGWSVFQIPKARARCCMLGQGRPASQWNIYFLRSAWTCVLKKREMLFNKPRVVSSW